MQAELSKLPNFYYLPYNFLPRISGIVHDTSVHLKMKFVIPESPIENSDYFFK